MKNLHEAVDVIRDLVTDRNELLSALKAIVVAYEGTDYMLGPAMTEKIRRARAAIHVAEGR